MKTLRFAFIAALIACAMVSLASGDGFKAKPQWYVHVTFEKAIHIPGLAAAMHNQLDPGFLKNEQPVYTQKVRLGKTIFVITGTRYQWEAFFYPKWVTPHEKKATFTISN